MWDKVRKRIVDACDVMDMVMAAVVVIGIVTVSYTHVFYGIMQKYADLKLLSSKRPHDAERIFRGLRKRGNKKTG